MIANEQQYWAIRHQAEKYEQELAQLQSQANTMDGDLLDMYQESLYSQLDELYAALEHYEKTAQHVK